MTAGRDLHDLHTVLTLLAHWDHLLPKAKDYAAHRLRLLYIAITKGWQAALFYDQQGEDEFLDMQPDFWTSFQPRSRPRAARGRSSTRRGRDYEPSTVDNMSSLILTLVYIMLTFFF
jgi:hypothetical protein